MKRMLIVFVALCLSLPMWAQANGSDANQKLMDMEHQWATAAKNGDWNSVSKMLSDNYVSTTATGKKMTKQESIEDMKSTKLDSGDVSDMQVHTFGNTAVVTGKFQGTGKDKNGKPLNINEAWTDTWVNQNGKWVCVASQSTDLNAAKSMTAEQ